VLSCGGFEVGLELCEGVDLAGLEGAGGACRRWAGIGLEGLLVGGGWFRG